MPDKPVPTLAEALRQEEDQLRRRWIHHTRPQRPLNLQEAMELAASVAVPNGDG
jgi:hypothetical protein